MLYASHMSNCKCSILLVNQEDGKTGRREDGKTEDGVCDGMMG